MKKALWIVSALLLAAAVGVALTAFEERRLIELEGGKIFAVEAVWVVGDDVFFQTGGIISSYPRRRVLHIAEGMPTDTDEIRLRSLRLAEDLKRLWRPVFEAVQRGRWALILSVAAATAILLGGWIVAVRRRRRKLRGKLPVGGASEGKKGGGPRLARRAEVENYFLDLYRVQLGADPQAQASIELVSDGAGPGHPYRLRVFHNGQWRERRMTISALGAESGSKSQCFYVIFDTHLVVKIPPVPIHDFSDYLRRLRKEAWVASRLAGRPCIIPNLAALLSRIVQFGPENDPQRLERRYLQWIEADASRQQYLKVGGAFAFFMDLSRHQFLGHVLAKLGDLAERIAEVAAEDVALIDDCQAFERKYGPESGPLCFELQSLYNAFDAGLRRRLAAGEADVVVTGNEKKEWLLAHLAGVPQPRQQPGASPAAGLRDGLLEEVAGSHGALMEAYRRLTVAEGRRRALQQGKTRMAALATNMLDLLVWLGERRVAMRDLKPDNLLVAGNAADDQHFLSEAGRFVIGLIDVETAVVYPSCAEAACAQPLLGGTPSYATPSHFFPNALLSRLYDDLGQVLHLQDWYATIAIIFEIVAGVRLFARTGRLFPGWIQTIRHTAGGLPETERVYRNFSRQFWNSARSEFDSRMAEADSRLGIFSVAVPESLHARLTFYLRQRDAELKDRIEATLSAQDGVVTSQRLRELASMNPAALKELIARYKEQNKPAAKRLVAVLDELATIRNSLSRIEDFVHAMPKTRQELPVKTLLSIMFEIVADGMQPPSLPADAGQAPVASTDRRQRADEATIGFTHTVNL